MRLANYAAALVVASLGITAIALSRNLSYGAEYGPGPGFLPFWLGVVLVILSAFIVRDARSDAAGGADADRDEAGSGSALLPRAEDGRKPWLILFGSTIALALLFQPLGLLLSTALFMLVTVRWIARRSWLSTVVFAAVTPIALYVGFVRLLAVPLPLDPPGF